MTSTRALTNRQILRAASIVLLGFLASGVLGLIRTAIISATFGASEALDAFYAAQRIPELIFTLVAGGALASAFIPTFNRRLLHENEPGAWELASAVITLSALAAAILSLVVIVLAPSIVTALLVPGKPAPVQELTTSLTRIMMLTPFVFSISGLLMGILQTYGRFLLPSLAISMNNIGLIIGALVIARLISPLPGTPAQVGSANIYGLAWGALLSALLHLAVQLPGLRTIRIDGPKLRFLADWRVPGVLDVLLLMGPRVLGLGIAQINFVVNVNFASRMVVGSQTALTTAWLLIFMVIGVIGQSVGTAVFPTLSALAAENDMEGFKDRLARALRGALFLALPATVLLIALGEPLIALLFERGEWTPVITSGTAWALAFYALGIVGHIGLEVLSRAFYALSDTRTPVLIGAVSLLSNIALSALFILILGQPDSLARGPFAGLALANSVTTLLEAAALWGLLRRRIGELKDRYMLDGLLRTAIAALVMLSAVLAFQALAAGRLSRLPTGLGALIIAGVAFVGTSLILRIEELQSVTSILRQRSHRSGQMRS